MHEEKIGIFNMVLGEEIKMHEVVNMVERVMVRKFHGHRMSEKNQRQWIEDIGRVLLNYIPTSSLLVRGWMALYSQILFMWVK